MNWDHPTAFWEYGPEEHAAIDRVIQSGQFTMGPEVKAFEEEFAAYHGMRHGIMVNSGSSANLIAVATLFHKRDNPLKRGDVAVVPAIAWSTTYAPLVQYGLELQVIDVDDTWNANVHDRDNAAKICKAKLMIGCSVLGNPAPLNYMKTLCGQAGTYMIEDNCESIGASSAGKLCGTFGLMNTFSFFITHQLSGIEGGMILTDDDECAALCRVLRAHGWTRDVQKPDSFTHEYDFRAMGYNVRPVEMHAAVARVQLNKLSAGMVARRENYYDFRNTASEAGLQLTFVEDGGTMNPFGIHFLCPPRDVAPIMETRSRVVSALRANSIDCRLPTGGSFRMHGYGKPWRDQPTPVADLIHRDGLFIGNAPWPIPEKIEKAIGVIKGALG